MKIASILQFLCGLIVGISISPFSIIAIAIITAYFSIGLAIRTIDQGLAKKNRKRKYLPLRAFLSVHQDPKELIEHSGPLAESFISAGMWFVLIYFFPRDHLNHRALLGYRIGFGAVLVSLAFWLAFTYV